MLSNNTNIQPTEKDDVKKVTWYFPPLSLLTEESDSPFVSLKSVFLSPSIQSSPSPTLLPFGIDMLYNNVFGDLKSLKHILITGKASSGKSCLLHTFLQTFLFRCKPEDLRLIIVDTKSMQFYSLYNGIPHLLTDVIREPESVFSALKWLIAEILLRRKVFTQKGVKDIYQYNTIPNIDIKPNIILIIDDLDSSELLSYFSGELEELLSKIIDLGYNAGVHVIATAKKINNEIINKFPTHFTFNLSSSSLSESILHRPGGDRLSYGDLLVLQDGETYPECFQSINVSFSDIGKLRNFLTNQLITNNRSNVNQNNIKNDFMDVEYENFKKTNETIINKFCEIASREVGIIDEYGDENWKILTPEKQRCIIKISTKLGISEIFLKKVFSDIDEAEISGVGKNIQISIMGQLIRYSLSQAGVDKVYNSYFLTELYFKDLNEIFKNYYKVHKSKNLGVNNYNNLSGLDFEGYIQQTFIRHGFDVSGTPVTGDQGADVIVIKNGKKLVIQAKRYIESVGNKAVQEIVSAIKYYDADEGWVVTNSTFTKSAIALAQKNDIKLIDKFKLPDLDKIIG